MSAALQRIRGFDGLRAFAFILVFISHKDYNNVTGAYGVLGVWLFFVLSGFLITRILAGARSDIEAGGQSYRSALSNFYMRRTLRIFPVYYAFLGVLTVLALLGLVYLDMPWRALCNWLYLTNFYVELHGFGSDDMGHLWSLAIEEQFYLLFAPLALAIPRRWLPHLCAGVLAVSVLAHLGLLLRGAQTLHFDANSLINFSLLVLGGLAGLSADRPLPRWLANDGVFVAAMLAFLAFPLLMSTELYARIGRLSGVFVALGLIQIYQNQKGLVVRLLDWAPLRQLGIISYGAYLFHPQIKSAALLPALGYGGPVPLAISMPVDFALTVVLATVSWRLLETPVRNLGRPRGSVARAAA